MLFSLSLCLILLGTALNLQVIRQKDYRALAEDTLTRTIPIEGGRGRILDRNGRELAVNRPSYTVNLYPYDNDSETVNRSILGVLSILDRYEDVTYLCALPLSLTQGGAQFTTDEIDSFLTNNHLEPSLSPEDALSTLYDRYALTSLDHRDAYRCLSLIMGSQNGENAYEGLSDRALSRLMDLCEGAGIVPSVTDGAIRFLLPESLDPVRLANFCKDCSVLLGHAPYEGVIPISSGEAPVWNTASIKRLKQDLSLPDSASANEVLSSLIEQYDAQSAVDSPYLLQLLAIRYHASDHYYRRYRPLAIATTLDYRICAVMAENAVVLPGVDVSETFLRSYPNGETLSQVLGYTGHITAEDEESYQSKGYRPTDSVGRDGLERILEDVLHPIPGETAVLVDHLGSKTRTLSTTPATDGADVTLTIDLPMQQAAESAIRDTLGKLQKGGYPNAKVGAAVAMDVNSGEVLCMASIPGYDPNLFSSPISEETWEALNPTYTTQSGAPSTDPTLPRPMVNTAVASIFPPGSTYKPFVAAALLENGIVTPTTAILDRGRYTGFSLSEAPGCWLYNQRGATHGFETVSDAIAHSCNYFFYDAAVRLGSNRLAEYARKFGFGESTGIQCLSDPTGILGGEAYTSSYLTQVMAQKLMKAGIPREEAETIAGEMVAQPTLGNAKTLLTPYGLSAQDIESLYEYLNDHRYRESQVLSLAIGQGENSFSVLQMACATAALSKKGLRYTPTLIHAIGEDVTEKQLASPAFLSEANYRAIVKGMVGTTRTGGTAAGAFDDLPVTVAAKTGTAEADGKDNYGWLIAFAPAEDPKIAIAVMMAQAGSSNACLPAARAILKSYFSPKEGDK